MKTAASVALPFVRQSDGEVVYFPSNLIENLYLSNGMSAGNTLAEAQVQCLSEIFERAVKREIIEGEFALPDVPADVLAKYPSILAGIQGLEAQGFPVLVKDASLGGEFPVMCVTLMNPRTGGVFASFGAHPSLEVALERSLTELLQGAQFRRPERSAAADVRRSRGDRAEQLRRALHRLQRRGLVALLQCPLGLRIRRVGLLRPGRKLQRRRSRDAVRHSREHGQGILHGGV
jgi:YcaO-like protein with predicted kinase domain